MTNSNIFNVITNQREDGIYEVTVNGQIVGIIKAYHPLEGFTDSEDDLGPVCYRALMVNHKELGDAISAIVALYFETRNLGGNKATHSYL